jgi:hypothetical protein
MTGRVRYVGVKTKGKRMGESFMKGKTGKARKSEEEVNISPGDEPGPRNGTAVAAPRLLLNGEFSGSVEWSEQNLFLPGPQTA